MTSLGRFEDLEAWQRARELTRTVYDYTANEAFERDPQLKTRLQFAAVSVMTHVAEGFERGSNREFIEFLFRARGSLGELRSLLYVGLDRGFFSEREFDRCCEICVRLSRIIWGLIINLREQEGTAENG